MEKFARIYDACMLNARSQAYHVIQRHQYQQVTGQQAFAPTA